MLHALMGVSLLLWGQSVCIYPREGQVVGWMIYHPLERGRGEAIARSIAEALFADSILQEVAYVHSVRYRFERRGPWFCIEGEATPEGLYAFFGALDGAVQRFPARLARVRRSVGQESDPFRWAYRRVYEDTAEVGLSPLQVSQAFFRYWREGGLRCMLWGRVPPPLIRVARQLVPEGQLALYVPPELPSALHQPPRQGPGIVYVRWRVSTERSLLTMGALWLQAQELLRYLCQEKGVACQARWVPLPTGLELWIETGLPVAAEAAAKEFLDRPLRVPSGGGNAFFTWLYEAQSAPLAAWWACVWGLPALPGKPTPFPAKEVRRVLRRTPYTLFAVGL